MDLPPWHGPPRTYVIATTPRAGSTLLCHALWSTGAVGAPREYLNPAQIRDWTLRLGPTATRLRHLPLIGPASALAALPPGEAALGRYLSGIRARRSGPTGWFGLKIHHHHYARWFRSLPPEHVLGPARWIWLRRRDRVGQAISWTRALQTARWASHEPGLAPPRYRPRSLRRALDSLALADNSWAAFFSSSDRPVLTVSYEQLIEDPSSVVNRILSFLGEPPVTDLAPPALERQADPRTERWRQRFTGLGAQP